MTLPEMALEWGAALAGLGLLGGLLWLLRRAGDDR